MREQSDYEKGDVECGAKADPDLEDNDDLFNKIKIYFVSHIAKSVKIDSINLIRSESQKHKSYFVIITS